MNWKKLEGIKSMNIVILGAAGFVGTNLAIKLCKDCKNKITLVDCKKEFFSPVIELGLNVEIIESDFSEDTDFDELLSGKDVVYHLVSTTIPTTSNQHIVDEFKSNTIATACLLDACVRNNISKVIFISSGGTVYGKEVNCPLDENIPTNPITSYGIQKVTIEKLLYLYNYMYNLDYRVIRLSNPYGPYQRPNGMLGAVTTFTYKAIKKEEIIVYGDGSVVRDFIYIDDAIDGIIKIANCKNGYKIYNLGSGIGISIKEVLKTISNTLKVDLKIKYIEGRKVDVHTNYLDISRYSEISDDLHLITLEEGINKTAEFMRSYYKI